jgi:hypothetical protein
MPDISGAGSLIPDIRHDYEPQAMRVEYPGAIYHVMDRGDAFSLIEPGSPPSSWMY